MVFKPYGPEGVLVSLGSQINESTHLKVKFLYEKLRNYAKNGIRAVIPGYCELTILFEPRLISMVGVKQLCHELSESFKVDVVSNRLVEIPVCYEEEFAIDMKDVIDYTGLTSTEIIELHSKNEYLVYMLGFVPGFLYLGGMDKQLVTPRKETPRLKVDKGSVGIADDQTGIYPMEIPGGWQIIGRSPVELLNDDPSLQIQMGDKVRFIPISKKEFIDWEK